MYVNVYNQSIHPSVEIEMRMTVWEKAGILFFHEFPYHDGWMDGWMETVWNWASISKKANRRAETIPSTMNDENVHDEQVSKQASNQKRLNHWTRKRTNERRACEWISVAANALPDEKKSNVCVCVWVRSLVRSPLVCDCEFHWAFGYQLWFRCCAENTHISIARTVFVCFCVDKCYFRHFIRARQNKTERKNEK